MSSTLASAASDSMPGRLPRSRSSSVTESASPESTSSDSHSSSDPDTLLSFTSITTAKGLLSMDVDHASDSHMMDMDSDIPFDTNFDLHSTGIHGIQAMNAFQNYNGSLDDVLGGLPAQMSPNKSDILMLEEIIKDGAFEPSTTSAPPSFQPYSARSPAFRDLFIPPPTLLESYPEPQPDPVCIDPSSTQSQPPAYPTPSPQSSPLPTADLTGVLLLSPLSHVTSGASTPVKHEPSSSLSSLFPYDSPSSHVSSEVLCPSRDICHDLPIFFPSIPVAGTKSRVETQIKLAFELGFPKSLPSSTASRSHGAFSSQASSSSSPKLGAVDNTVSETQYDGVALGLPTHDRVGSYRFLRLPRGTATKRRPGCAIGMRRDPRPSEVQLEDTLEMTAHVVCCSAPHALVHSCSSCQSREAKRTARKLAARVRPPSNARPKTKGKTSNKRPGKRAKNDNVELEDAAPDEEDEEEPNVDASILQFNCSEVLDFGCGSVVLPMRITCYCRHHKEKVGFNIVFTLRDHTGRVVGKGTTPPILITDDHKSTSAVSKLPPMHPLRRALNSSPPTTPPAPTNVSEEPKPTHVYDQEQARAPAKRRDTDDAVKKRRPKPYDGRPTNRGAGVGPGIEGRQGVVLALHPAHAKAQSDGAGGSGNARNATPPTASPGAESIERPSSNILQTSLPQGHQGPETSLPSPPPSMNGAFVRQRDVVMSALRSSPELSHPPSPLRITGTKLLPTAPPSPSSLSSPPSSQTNAQICQPPQSLPDLQSFSQDQHELLDAFPMYPSLSFTPDSVPLPKIHRLIPSSGPTTGGIEITILGSDFHASLPLECVFGGAVASSTHRWSDNTLVCILPPCASPGLVTVEFKGIKNETARDETGNSLFNYVDESDRQLMELALQVVGLKMTGKIEEARSVALRIVGSTNAPTPTMTPGELSQMNTLSGTPLMHHPYLGSLGAMDLEVLIVKLLTLLDVPPQDERESLPSGRRVIGHQNVTGQTLLHLAVLLALPALVSCLIERSIDLDARNNNGLTALHFAALTGWQEGTELLLAAGADASIADSMGLTAARRAKNGRFEELARLLDESVEHESVHPGDSGDEGDDEAWHSEELSEDAVSDAAPSPSWPPGPPQYAALSRMALPSPTDSSPDDLSEPDLKSASRGSVAQIDVPSADSLPRQASADDKSTTHEKRDASFVERLQRTLPQGILPNVQIPGLPQLQLPDRLAGPWGAFPQIPVFPIFVPIPNLPHLPNWPAFPWPDALTGEKKEARVDGTNGEKQPPLAMLWTAYDNLTNSDWRAQWEKWTAQVTALQNANTRETESPPMYTPRPDDKQARPETQAPVSTGDGPGRSTPDDTTTEDTPGLSTIRTPGSKATRRMGYRAVNVSETEVDSYHYQPKRKAVQKKDRMLVFFWIPILFIGLAYALYTALPVAVAGLSRASKRIFPPLPQQNEIRV